MGAGGLKKSSELAIMRRVMQGGFILLAFGIGLRHALPDMAGRGGSFDEFCPFGGIESLWALLRNGQALQTNSLMNVTALAAVVAVSLAAGKAFCGWMCPLGALQDLLAGMARRLGGGMPGSRGSGGQSQGRGCFPIETPYTLDRRLRAAKYLVLALIVAASIRASYPPLHRICPARAVFSLHWDTPLLGLVLFLFILSSMLVRRFSCKYLCPMGAVLSVSNRISSIQPVCNPRRCTDCGRCTAVCPVDLQPVPDGLGSAECIRCLECMEACPVEGAIDLYLGLPGKVRRI